MKLELEEIYKTYFQDVYYFVLAMSKDPHIAEEITQETWVRVTYHRARVKIQDILERRST